MIEEIVKHTIECYQLINKGDRIVVACSGGKDSTTILYLLNKWGYEPDAMIIDLMIGDWSKKNLDNLRYFCEQESIPLHVIPISEIYGCSMCYIRSVIQSRTNLPNCSICGVIKRYLLNREARKMKADKIVTGHNMDDEAQATLMNFLQGNLQMMAKMGPKVGVIQDKRFVARVKPLYYCLERDILNYSKEKGFKVLYDRCPCSVGALRRQIRGWLDELETIYPNVKKRIVDNVSFFVPLLRKKMKKKRIGTCSICGEPSSSEVCVVCKMWRT